MQEARSLYDWCDHVMEMTISSDVDTENTRERIRAMRRIGRITAEIYDTLTTVMARWNLGDEFRFHMTDPRKENTLRGLQDTYEGCKMELCICIRSNHERSDFESAMTAARRFATKGRHVAQLLQTEELSMIPGGNMNGLQFVIDMPK